MSTHLKNVTIKFFSNNKQKEKKVAKTKAKLYKLGDACACAASVEKINNLLTEHAGEPVALVFGEIPGAPVETEEVEEEDEGDEEEDDGDDEPAPRRSVGRPRGPGGTFKKGKVKHKKRSARMAY